MRSLLVEAFALAGFLGGFLLLLCGAAETDPIRAVLGALLMFGALLGFEAIEELLA